MADLEQEFLARYSQRPLTMSTMKSRNIDADTAALIRQLFVAVQGLQKDLVKVAHDINGLRDRILAVEEKA